MQICDGCNVLEPWEHKCHGLNAIVSGERTEKPCECLNQACMNVRKKQKSGNPAVVDKDGLFHCPCGATHKRGPFDGFNTWRCLCCGATYKVTGLVKLR